MTHNNHNNPYLFYTLALFHLHLSQISSDWLPLREWVGLCSHGQSFVLEITIVGISAQ